MRLRVTIPRAPTDALLEEFSVTKKSADEIRSLLESCDRTLVFS